ncbi:recombinase family protein [Bacillus sp. M6-12]|uniref:recombinase family protein n=1 Tax=Bacillus sp. M6-12 TaxID=2054166 RepID=UPI000C77898E|nr:recombinase family protein [Bacillus sp. M6-12]PLS17617.1 recombinase family protein [Bacillus sp. M6-12]
MKTVAYYRNSISAEKQKLSIEMQMQHVQDSAKKKRLLIDDEFIDRETSARKTSLEQRNGMNLLMEEMKKGRVKNLIVYSRCRLARNVQQYMKLFELLKEHKINVIFAAEFEFPMTYTVESELIERILAAMNQADADKLVQKLQDAKMTKAKDGKHAAGAIPFGYRKGLSGDEAGGKKEEWEKVESEWKVIEDIYNLFLSEEFNSLSQYVNLANETGSRKRDKEWDYQSMKKLLTNPVYKGERIFNSKGEAISRKVPEIQIVSDLTWDRAQRKMKEIVKKYEKIEEEVEKVYLLEQLVNCADCNEVMKGKKHVAKGETTFVYKCKKHSKIRVEKDWLEETVIEQANKFFQEMVQSNFSEVIERMYKGEASSYLELIKQVEGEIKHLEDKMAERTELTLETGSELFLDPTMLESIKKYEQSQFILSELGARIEEIKDKFHTVMEWKKETMIQLLRNEMDDQEKMELIQDIVFGIDVSPDSITIVFQHPLFTAVKGRSEIGLN